MHGLLQDLGITIIIATLVNLLMHRFKQPSILGYLAVGVIVGPKIGPQLISDMAHIEIISEIGLILLLFIIGLEMDIPKLIKSGKELVVAGMGQFLLCAVYGVVFFVLMGYTLQSQKLDALYLAIFCGLSSTAIVVKLLYDKFELDTLSGRITLGVLIFQDIWAILIISFQPHFHHPQASIFALTLLKTAALLATGFFFGKYILSRLYAAISKEPELVVIVSIGWCAALSAFAGWLGLSKEMGALVAGLSVSTFPYSIHVTAKIGPLRDFFLTLFFISLGMSIPMPEVGMLKAAAMLVIFVYLSRFLSVYPLLALCGSGRRTAFLSSLNLSQISEFSLVIATLAISHNHIDPATMSILLYGMAITSILTSYQIKYSQTLFRLFDRTMNRIGLRSREAKLEEDVAHGGAYPVVVLGYHRGARAFTDAIAREQPELLKKILVVDFNLEILRELQQQGIHGMFGDISSLDTLMHAHIDKAGLILSTIPDFLLKGTDNIKLTRMCRRVAPEAAIVATADFKDQIPVLKEAGATQVLLPYSLAGEQLARYVIDRIPALEVGQNSSKNPIDIEVETNPAPIKELQKREATMNIPQKARDTVSVLVPTVIVLAMVSIFFSYHINEKSAEIRGNWLPSTIHLNNLNTLTSDFRIMELQHILSMTDQEMRLYENQRNQKLSEMRGEMARYEKLITTDLERTLYLQFQGKWNDYLTESRLVLDLSKQNRNEEAKAHIRSRSQTLFDEYSNLLLALVRENQVWAEKASDRGNRLFFFSWVTTAFISLTIGYLLYRSLKAITARYNEIAALAQRTMKENFII